MALAFFLFICLVVMLSDYGLLPALRGYSPPKKERSPGSVKRSRAKLGWYVFIVVCAGGIILALSQQAKAQEAPEPALGCNVFNAGGHALKLDEMTDKQLMQVRNCVMTRDAQDAAARRAVNDTINFERQMADSNASLNAMNENMQASADAFARIPLGGYAAPIPTPLPGNAPTIILQMQ